MTNPNQQYAGRCFEYECFVALDEGLFRGISIDVNIRKHEFVHTVCIINFVWHHTVRSRLACLSTWRVCREPNSFLSLLETPETIASSDDEKSCFERWERERFSLSICVCFDVTSCEIALANDHRILSYRKQLYELHRRFLLHLPYWFWLLYRYVWNFIILFISEFISAWRSLWI